MERRPIPFSSLESINCISSAKTSYNVIGPKDSLSILIRQLDGIINDRHNFCIDFFILGAHIYATIVNNIKLIFIENILFINFVRIWRLDNFSSWILGSWDLRMGGVLLGICSSSICRSLVVNLTMEVSLHRLDSIF